VTVEPPSTGPILVERRGPTTVITLNRPHRNNAWTGRMHAAYRQALQDAEDDPRCRVIVITGAGRSFCVGADAAALDRHAERGGYDPGVDETSLANPGYGVRDDFDADFAHHFGLRTPVIAAVNGAAAGVGMVLACYADLRIAADDARFTTAHGRLNLPAEYGLSWLLPRMIGVGRAMDVLLSSRVIGAGEALELGLVNRVVPAEDLLDAAVELAEQLAGTVSRRSLAETKRQIYTDLHRDLRSSVEEAGALLDEMMGEADFGRGLASMTDRSARPFAEPAAEELPR